MAYIDKTYIVDYHQFIEVRDWCKGKIVETDNGLKYHAEDFLNDKDMTEEYFNNWKKEVIENRMRNYGETYEDAYKRAEIPLWNTPFYFDRWLIKNCPIQFIQDRLKYQYDEEYEQIKNGTSSYDTYKRNGLGKNFHYKVIRKPNWKPRYNFYYINRLGEKTCYKESQKPWWLITVYDIKNEYPISWWANTNHNYWTNSSEGIPFNSNMMDIKKKNLNIHSIIRMIKKWDLPDGSQVRVLNRYFNYGWIINIKK